MEEQYERSKMISLKYLGIVELAVGILGMVWCFAEPALGSERQTAPPAHAVNEPAASVYLGNGCFWHTQYDFVVLEQDAGGAFGGRTYEEVTALVGYAGGSYEGPDSKVCYHGVPTTDYSKMGHAEVVSVTLGSGNATRRRQFEALATLYFEV